MRRLIGGAIYVLSGVLGVLAFAYPFVAPETPLTQGQVAPLVTAGLVGLALLALLVELQGRTLSAKTVATLGVLVAVTSVLRFVEVAIPLPGGFSPVFAPILVAGYVFGPRFGFLMGAFTLLVSGLVTGGVGPWLPFQMFSAGWVGLSAGALPRERLGSGRWAVGVLSAFGFVWGFVYGVIINLYFWPFALGPEAQSWQVGLGLGETVARYAAFYAVTSLAWDVPRAVGNAGLILALGGPLVKALRRFRQRFDFEVVGGG
jgi:energy-coupling factor transport system substrate-specific component